MERCITNAIQLIDAVIFTKPPGFYVTRQWEIFYLSCHFDKQPSCQAILYQRGRCGHYSRK
ncbi:MAG: hypothetical protein ACLFVE_15505, partial [Chitinispirillaceae bacterium]